jgi:signal peptidase I
LDATISEPHDGADGGLALVETDDPDEANDPPRSFWRELPVLVLVALVIAVVVKTFLFQAFYIPSGSMLETLQINDRVLVNKLSYRFGDVHRGDVVVFDRGNRPPESPPEALFRNLLESIGIRTPEADLIKRVIGLPGETIEIRDNTVYVDGAPLREPYLREGTHMPDFPAEKVPQGEYFVMGDNRNSSRDSRFDGPIESEHIVGRAFVIVWPPSNWSGL